MLHFSSQSAIIFCSALAAVIFAAGIMVVTPHVKNLFRKNA